MKAQDLAQLFIEKLGDWHLEYEVLWITFQVLIDDCGITEEQLEKALREGFSEWDL